MGVNKAILIGNLGADPELRYAGDNPVLNFRIAVNEKFKGRDGERKERTEWFSCAIWGKRAEALSKHLSKGDRVYVEGGISTREYEKRDGGTGVSVDINVREIELLGGNGERSEDRGSRGGGGGYGGDRGRGDGGRGNGGRGNGGGRDDSPSDDFGDDNIPF